MEFHPQEKLVGGSLCSQQHAASRIEPPEIIDLVQKGLWFDGWVWQVSLGRLKGILYAWKNTCKETGAALQTARQS